MTEVFLEFYFTERRVHIVSVMYNEAEFTTFYASPLEAVQMMLFINSVRV